jgi:predicted Zn-dependent protease
MISCFIRAGLFQVARNADQLAGILGHEMAHVLARHASENLTRRILPLLGVVVFEALTGSSAGGNMLLNIAELLVGLPNSRRAEAEADRIGVEISALACYNPRGLAQSLQVCLIPLAVQFGS